MVRKRVVPIDTDYIVAGRPVTISSDNFAAVKRLYKEELLRLDYPSHLWMEKEIKSVANVARRDISEFLDIAAEMKIRPEVEEYTLDDANRALHELKLGKIRGAKVLCIN